MDPTAAWNRFVASLEAGDKEEAREAARDLFVWLDSDGFPPRVTDHPAADAFIARSVCQAAIVEL